MGDRIRFDEVGDRAKGRITNVEVFTGMGNGWKYDLANVAVRQSNTQEMRNQAEVIATPTNLVAQLKEQRPRTGDTLDIELIDLRKTAAGTAKIFRVETTKAEPGQIPGQQNLFGDGAAAPTPAPTAPAPAAPDDDLFG